MKTAIKIIVPLLVLVGIMAIIISTQQSINELHSKAINPYDFKAYAAHFSADSIGRQSTDRAREQYDRLYDIITTEASVTITDSSGSHVMLSNADAEDCYKNAFNAYFNIFRDYSDDVFRSSSWPDSKLNKIRNEAIRLSNKSRKGSRDGVDSLNRYVAYVNEYYRAKGIIYAAKSCRGLNVYNKVYSYCQNFHYRRYPYCNNADLRPIASAVQTAQEKWQTSLKLRVEAFEKKDYAGDYTTFSSDQVQLILDINEYQRYFSSSWGNAEKTRVNAKSI